MSNNNNYLKILIFVLFLQNIYSFKYPINQELENAQLEEVASIEVSTKDEFDKIIMNNDYVISVFHADWCGHCKRFLPVFDKASRYKVINSKWVLAKIPCSKYGSLCDSFNINGYPTIKTFKKSKEVKISPPRDLEPFLEFLIKLSSSPLINIENNDTQKFYKEYGTFSPLVEYNSKNEKFISCVKNLAENDLLAYYYFGLLKNDNINKEKIIFDFDNNNIEYIWNDNCKDVEVFLRNNLIPLVSNIDVSFMRQMNRHKKKLFMLFYNSNNDKINTFINQGYKDISKSNRNLAFGYVKDDKSKDLSNYFKINITKESEIQLLIYDFGKETRYKHPNSYDVNINTIKEIEDVIRDLAKNINSLPFTSGSKFKDFFRKIGLADMSSTTTAIIFVTVFTLVIACLCIMAFFCDTDEDEAEEKVLLNKDKDQKKDQKVEKDDKKEKETVKKEEGDKKLKKD